MTELRKIKPRNREDNSEDSPLTNPSSSDWSTYLSALGSELSQIPGRIVTYWPTVVVFTFLELGEHVIRDAVTMPDTLYANRAVDSLIKSTRELATLSAYNG